MTQARQVIPPPPPPAPVVQLVTPAPYTVPAAVLTVRDLDALRARKNELSNLLQNVNGRRREVETSLRNAVTPADRAGLEQRLKLLDDRITRIEGEIDQNSSQLASLDAMRLQVPPPSLPRARRDRVSDNMVPISIVFVLFVLAPMAIARSRSMWRRGSAQPLQNRESEERMTRMEHAIDSIAIEVERVSEGQRFVTRLLAEARPGVPAVAAPKVPEARPAERVITPR